jgi:NADPH:quinone reductase-like Zn-dependent oxidoreductase
LHKEAIMKAICVTSDRKLEVRNLPTPETPAPGHILVDIDAATITHGDKFFLTVPLPGGATPARGPDIYGANGGGRVVAIGEGVPSHYAGKQVAIYRGFRRTADSTGLWCERAQVHHARNLSFQRFSNFMSPTVRDEQRLAAALATIGSLIGDPMFKTRIGKEFSFDQIDEAMAYSDGGGERALLV